jgi:integrase
MTVYQTETGAWRFDFEAKGKRRTGSGFATKRDALAAQEMRRREATADLSAGISTFHELVDAFLSMSARTKSAAWTYQMTVKLNKACAHLGPVLLTELRPEHFEAILAKLHRSGKNSARSLNEYRKIMCAVLEYAVKLEALHRNPVKKIDRQPERSVPVKPVETAVLKQLILAADPVLSALLTFQSQTGARWIECQRLRWPDCHLETRQPFCTLRTKKNRRREDSDRAQPLNRIAVDAIGRLRGIDSEQVFPAGRGGAMEYRTVIKRLHELCDRLGLARVSFSSGAALDRPAGRLAGAIQESRGPIPGARRHGRDRALPACIRRATVGDGA